MLTNAVMSSGPHLYVLGLALCVIHGGCVPPAAEELAGVDVDPALPAPPAADGCAVDSDCRLAATGCCECPSYAVSVLDRADDACAEIPCDEDGTCPQVAAVCQAGACVMQCEPVSCELSCAGGFAIDEAGCLVCWCAPEPPPGDRQCAAAEDCARVPADCCGCARGGHDTAVPADDAQAHIDGLACPADPACPEVDACEEGMQAGCIAGMCTLLGTGFTDLPGGPTSDQWCGSPELAPCPGGTECVLNVAEANDASLAGVGICVSR